MTMVSPDDGRPSISKTTRYKKVTKPLLERKRRARINRCLDELKDLMVGAFEVEGDNISKLEKADILELTVRHLTKLHSPRDPIADAKRFRAGFGQCATEACQFILSMPEIDKQISENLIKHLSTQIGDAPLTIQVPSRQTFSPPVSPATRNTWPSPQNTDYARSVHEYPPKGHSSSQQTNYNTPDPIHVPLMCDTMGINSTPSVYDLSKPMTGLLMTVDSTKQQNLQYDNSQHTYNLSPTSAEIKRKHDAEVKNVIMKRIREQILGRQVKEIDMRETVSSTSHDTVCFDNSYNRNYCINESAYASVDLRKKSKGEYKHYSPRFDTTYSEMQTKSNERAPSKYEYGPDIAINYSIAKKDADTQMNNVDNVNYIPSELGNSGSAFKRKYADYRNIHPKKVIIRPMMKSPDAEQTVSTTHERSNLSTLRQHRLPNAARHSDYSNVSPNVPLNYSSTSNHRRDDFSNPSSSRDVNMGRPVSEVQPEDLDSDHMWRPW